VAELTLRIKGGLELKRLQEDLKKAERADLDRMLRRNVRAAAKPVIAELRTAVMNTHVSSSREGHARPDKDTQLRARIARAVTTSLTRKGVRIVVPGRRVGPYGAALSKYLDASITGYVRWRHPVFGHDVWVEQHGQPWFFNTIERHATDFRLAVLAAVDEIAHILKG
jgi:hypothetical protein